MEDYLKGQIIDLVEDCNDLELLYIIRDLLVKSREEVYNNGL